MTLKKFKGVVSGSGHLSDALVFGYISDAWRISVDPGCRSELTVLKKNSRAKSSHVNDGIVLRSQLSQLSTRARRLKDGGNDDTDLAIFSMFSLVVSHVRPFSHVFFCQ